MRLKKIDIQGFKSFAKRVEIVLDGNITAIIGPNGSGKSNVADAIRWVLGEQSAKSLRGNKMEDIIFGGSDSAKAAGFCEVVLTFDNADATLPIDFITVTVMRRVYRSGESEYLLNGNRCRLKDIIQLFRDTGVGKEGYSIIGQGRVDEILSGREEERRSVFEEAAGISKYKARKEEAERKLEKTDENLIRIEDILQELNAQLIPLQKQSDDAKQYLQLYEQTKIIDLNLFLYDYEQTNRELTLCKEKETQIQTEQGEHAKYVTELKEEQEAGQIRLKNVQENLEQEKKKQINETLAVEQLISQEKLIEQETGHYLEQNQVYINESIQLKERLEMLENDQKDWDKSADNEQEKREFYQQELIKQKQACEELNQKIKIKETQLEKSKQEVIAQMNRATDAKVEETRLNGLLQAIKERLEQTTNEFEQANQECMQVQNEIIQEETVSNAMNDSKQFQSIEYQQLQEQEKEIDADIFAKQEEYQKLKQKYDESYLKLQVLSDMKEEREGYFSSVRKLLSDIKNDSQNKLNVIGVVAELIYVPSEYEVAIEIALGSSLQHIVVVDETAAKNAIQHLREKQYGRATFLPLTTIRGRSLTDKEKITIENEASCWGIASQLIHFDKKYNNIIENLLGRTVICKDLQSGIALAKMNQHAFRIVTCAGDIIQAGGSMTGGSVKKSNTNLLGRERQMIKWRNQIQQYELTLHSLKEIIDEKKQEKIIFQQRLLEIEQNIHTIEIDYTRQIEKIEMLKKIAQQYQQQEIKARNEQITLQDNQQDIERQLELIKEQEKKVGKSEFSEENIFIEQQKLQELRHELELAMQHFNENNIRLAELEQASLSKQQLQQRIQMDIHNAQEKLVQLQQNIEQNGQNIEKNKQQRQIVFMHIQEKQTFLENSRQQVQNIQEQLNYETEQLASMSQRLQEAQTRLQTLIDRQHQNALKMNRMEIELESLHERIWNEYELTYEGATGFRDESIDLSLAKDRLNEQRQAMRALGNINVQAIDDYQAVQVRTNDLTLQRDDLITAKTDLQGLIQELLQQMKIQFLDQFEQINANFTSTFIELFGGGHAELRLSDREDVLKSNIEIIAQPPGKKMQLLSLLSGGERALTAIALLFSMLKLKPTPFCLLDEIEASLDEANVDNFANYLKRYSQKTQFILITHRKGSMAVSDSLYGIAMEGRGVSKIVSVKLEDYLEKIE